VKFGITEIFAYEFKNPFNNNTLFQVSIHDPDFQVIEGNELSLINVPHEWTEICKLRGFKSPPDINMISSDYKF